MISRSEAIDYLKTRQKLPLWIFPEYELFGTKQKNRVKGKTKIFFTIVFVWPSVRQMYKIFKSEKLNFFRNLQMSNKKAFQ